MGLFRRATPTMPADIAEVRSEMTALREALEQHGSAAGHLEGRLEALDARVTAVSTELANQLTELGQDIDALGARTANGGPEPTVLGEIREGQVRLANEQVRYQIAFREDLARLAGDLKRPR